MRSCFVLACVALATAVGGSAACRRSPAAGATPETATIVPPEVPAANTASDEGARLPTSDAGPDEGSRVPPVGSNSSHHDEFCRPERHEGFASDFPCTFDSECVPCECRPVNRAEHARLGGDAWCERFNQPPAREECIATNPACCDGHCVLAR